MPCTVTKACCRRLVAGQDSHTADLTATTCIVPVPWASEQAGGGFPAFITMTPVPLFEKPAKQELPQPVRAAAKRMTTQPPKRRRSQLEERSNSSLDRAIRPPVEPALHRVFYAEKVAHDGRFIKDRMSRCAAAEPTK